MRRRAPSGRRRRLALNGDADADHAGLSRRIFSGKRSDVLRRNCGDRRDPIRRVGLDAAP